MRAPHPALRLPFVGWWVWVTWMRLASSSRLGARPRAGFRFGGLEMTEPGASPDDPWVKASPAGAHAGEGRAGRARARGGAARRGDSLQSPKFPPPSGPRGCREDSSHPARAKVGRQVTRVCTSVRGQGLGLGEVLERGRGQTGSCGGAALPWPIRCWLPGQPCSRLRTPGGCVWCVCAFVCTHARVDPAIACAPWGVGVGRVCARAQ